MEVSGQYMRGLIYELMIGILMNVEMRMQFTEAVFLSEELLWSVMMMECQRWLFW